MWCFAPVFLPSCNECGVHSRCWIWRFFPFYCCVVFHCVGDHRLFIYRLLRIFDWFSVLRGHDYSCYSNLWSSSCEDVRSHFFLSKYLGVELLGHTVTVCLTLQESGSPLPGWLYRLTFPPARDGSCSWSASSPALGGVGFLVCFLFRRSNQRTVVSRHGPIITCWFVRD